MCMQHAVPLQKWDNNFQPEHGNMPYVRTCAVSLRPSSHSLAHSQSYQQRPTTTLSTPEMFDMRFVWTAVLITFDNIFVQIFFKRFVRLLKSIESVFCCLSERKIRCSHQGIWSSQTWYQPLVEHGIFVALGLKWRKKKKKKLSKSRLKCCPICTMWPTNLTPSPFTLHPPFTRGNSFENHQFEPSTAI